jgi:hypothetical protein
MKKSIAILASLVVLGSAASSFADTVGVVNLSSYDSGFAVIGFGGTAVDPATTYVQLLYSADGNTWSTVATSGGATKWSPDDSSGYFDGGYGILDTDTANKSVNFKIQAWTGGDTYASATYTAELAWSQTSGSWDRGSSTSPAGTPNPTTLALTGNLNLVPAPEPSTIALGLLGAGALLIRRRK